MINFIFLFKYRFGGDLLATSGNKDVVATKTTSGNTGDTLRFKWSRKDYSTSGNYTNIN